VLPETEWIGSSICEIGVALAYADSSILLNVLLSTCIDLRVATYQHLQPLYASELRGSFGTRLPDRPSLYRELDSQRDLLNIYINTSILPRTVSSDMVELQDVVHLGPYPPEHEQASPSCQR